MNVNFDNCVFACVESFVLVLNECSFVISQLHSVQVFGRQYVFEKKKINRIFCISDTKLSITNRSLCA